MKKENNYYIDENGNKWNCSIYTEEQAINFSKTMINCRSCSDCSDCTFCRYCSDCSYCGSCSSCSDCRSCSSCSSCSFCISCSDCSSCSYCRYCNSCSDCSSCSSCSYCRSCSEYKANPERIVSKKIGRRKQQTTVYFLEDKIQVVCGCYRGNLIEFEVKVKEVYKGNNDRYYKEYSNFIKKVKNYMK